MGSLGSGTLVKMFARNAWSMSQDQRLLYHATESRRLNYKNRFLTLSELKTVLCLYMGDRVEPVNIALYHQALTHKSYILMDRKKINMKHLSLVCPKQVRDIATHRLVPLQRSCNERLEYLGDAEIYSAVAHYLFCRYPEQNEGFLSKLRIKLIKAQALARLAVMIGLDRYLIISRHQEEINGRTNQSILEDAMEAFVGAIVEDLGFLNARRFFVGALERHVDFALLNQTNTNHKDTLLRYYQARGWGHPRYRLCEHQIDNDAHTNRFTVYLLDRYGQPHTKGHGANKKEAEQDASYQALFALGAISAVSEPQDMFEI